MTKEQITKYEYCKKHLQGIKNHLENLPFKIQQYGCGQSQPNIEYTLEKIHIEMYTNVVSAIKEAESKVQKIVDEI
jgi:hypothetical protein